MKRIYDVVAYLGKDKNDKAINKNVGVVLEDDKGYKKLKLNHQVTTDNDGKVVSWFNFYEPKNNNQQHSKQTDDFEDDIDF
jgi:hypothetical protein